MIGHLVLKDLRRDLRTAWQPLLLCLVPLFTTFIIATTFAPQGDEKGFIPEIRVALLDQDEGPISGFLGSMSGQSDVNTSLRVFNVETEAEGLAMLERWEASAFVVLPEQFSEDLIDGVTTTIRIYENPAEQLLPRAVAQGTEVIAVFLSAISPVIGEPLREIDRMFDQDEWPDSEHLSEFVVQTSQQIRSLESALFPPIVQYELLAADDYIPSISREVHP